MHEIRCTLEDDRVGEFDAPCVTLRHDARRAGYCGRRPDESAKRDCRFATYWPKVSKPHCVGVVVACFHRRPEEDEEVQAASWDGRGRSVGGRANEWRQRNEMT